MAPFSMRRLVLSAIAGSVVAMPVAAAEQKLVADDTEIYYGIMPAEIVKKEPDKETSAMHGGKARRNFRHLVVAIFDAKTGQRVSDATVTATVTPLGLAPARKRLEQMRIDETVTYGNFFEFPADSAPFRIELKLARPKRPEHSISFEYRP